ncbi:MAG: tetratricopeptide repeat protein [Bdellovibrionota bacterium]
MSVSVHKQLKKPDEFVSQGRKILDWIAEREMWFLGIIGGLILAIVLVYGGRALTRRQLERNFAQLDKVVRVMTAEVGPKSVSSLEELEKLEEEGPARFDTEEEKWKAVAAAIDEVEPKLSRESAEWMAAYYKGEAQRELKNNDAAIAAFEAYAEKVKSDPFLGPLAYYNVAVAQMDADQYEKALESLGKARKAVPEGQELGKIGQSIVISEALCHARLGKPEEAKKALQELDTNYTVAADSLGTGVIEAALSQGLPDAFGAKLPAAPAAPEKGK